MRKNCAALRIVLLAMLMLAPEWVAAQSAMPSEIASIKNDLERIKTELADLKRQLGTVLGSAQQRPVQDASTSPASRVHTSVADAPVLGRADAPVTLVEFSDYQCP